MDLLLNTGEHHKKKSFRNSLDFLNNFDNRKISNSVQNIETKQTSQKINKTLKNFIDFLNNYDNI